MLKRCRVELEFTFLTRHKADLTNKAESVMDLLVDSGVIEDDNHFVVERLSLVSLGVDRDKAGCTVIIDDLQGDASDKKLAENQTELRLF